MIAYLWDMVTFWECRFCRRRWKKKEPMDPRNEEYLSDHVRQHTGMTRKPASEIPALLAQETARQDS